MAQTKRLLNVFHPNLTLHSSEDMHKRKEMASFDPFQSQSQLKTEVTGKEVHQSSSEEALNANDALSSVVSYYFDNETIPTEYSLNVERGIYTTQEMVSTHSIQISQVNFEFDSNGENFSINDDGVTRQVADSNSHKNHKDKQFNSFINQTECHGSFVEQIIPNPTNKKKQDINGDSGDENKGWRDKLRPSLTIEEPSLPVISRQSSSLYDFEKATMPKRILKHPNPPLMSQLKDTFEDLSKVFSYSKIYSQTMEQGPHFGESYKYREFEIISTLNTHRVSRLDSSKRKRHFHLLNTDGILQNKDMEQGVDFKYLINERGKGRLVLPPESWLPESALTFRAARKHGKRSFWENLRFSGKVMADGFIYEGCWSFEQCKPVLVVPHVDRLNEFGYWKFSALLNTNDAHVQIKENYFVKLKKVTEYENIKELLLHPNHGIEFDCHSSINFKKRCCKIVENEIGERLKKFALEFYSRAYHEQLQIREIESRLNRMFCRFVDTLVEVYWSLFLKPIEKSEKDIRVPEMPQNYVIMFQTYMKTKTFDFGYLWAVNLNIDLDNTGENSINAFNNRFREDTSNYEVGYALLLDAYLQSHDVHAFILRSLLFRVDLSSEAQLYDHNEVLYCQIAAQFDV